MKTAIIIAAVLTLQVSTLFAANDFPPLTPNNDASISCGVSLVPITPVEATFEFEDMPSEMISFVNLAPIAPSFADFDDAVVLNVNVDNVNLAPAVPAEADFE
jgi:hypothetical protein